MKHYTHFSLEEREKLYKMKKVGLGLREMGRQLKRAHSNISRELKRNSHPDKDIGYLPDSADNLAFQRIARHGSKISRNYELKELVITKMRDDKLSPEMIAGCLKLENAEIRLSHEAIYQYIYSDDGMKLGLYKYLMRRRPKRNQRYGRKTRSNHGISDRISISQRPAISPDEFGHIEADTTFFSGNQSINLLTMVERKTGFLLANLNKSKNSEDTIKKTLANLLKIPKSKRKSLTMDNGKEFVKHMLIRQVLQIPTFFCHPGSPWEKPYVENTHALLHRFLPKNTDPKTLTEEIVQNAVNKLNNLPRKRFGFRTPAEMMANETFLYSGALRT